MAEEHKLELILTPKVDLNALKSALTGVVDGSLEVNSSENGATQPASEAAKVNQVQQQTIQTIKDDVAEIGTEVSNTNAVMTNHVTKNLNKISSSASFIQNIHSRLKNLRNGKSLIDGAKSDLVEDTSIDSEKMKIWEDTLKNASMKALSSATSGMKRFGTELLGFVEDIYKRMKAASPLLQAVESMFNLAVQMFFMPLGNKLAEVMIPAVVGLLDKVTSLWDAFDGMSLGEAISFAIKQGTEVFGEYFEDIGTTLSSEEGIVGSIGRTLDWVGGFIKTDGERLLETIVNLANWLIKHIGEFIEAYITLKGVEIGAQTFSSIPMVGSILGATIGAGVGFGISAPIIESLGLPKYGDGGYVPYSPGGTPSIVAEKEGEYIIPESKMRSIGSTEIVNNFYISGVNSDELGTMITDKINEQISLSKIRGAF